MMKYTNGGPAESLRMVMIRLDQAMRFLENYPDPHVAIGPDGPTARDMTDPVRGKLPEGWHARSLCVQLAWRALEDARRRAPLAEALAECRGALEKLMPFVLDDYKPDFATPTYRAAVERAQRALGMP